MPVTQCSNGKWKIGSGKCMYHSKASAEKAWHGYLASGGEEHEEHKEKKHKKGHKK